ncbi:MAG: hypothetical protein K6A39_07385 [Clostridiales bacterium]|nr:hypothetical protein [Clostridiales bacterium]
MARRKRRRFRLNPRFFIIIGVLFVVAVAAVYLLRHRSKSGSLSFDSVSMERKVAGAIIREETAVSTDRYEKINFHVIEGDMIANNALIATVYRMGYQDESMITILNLEKEIYQYQAQQVGSADATLNDINSRITAVEELIRDVARQDSSQDDLVLEKQLRSLQQERSDYLYATVPVDTYLQGLITQLNDQKATISNWTRDIINTAGSGIISFYFDGYEDVLSSSKLSTVNVALIRKVVRGLNTSMASTSSSKAMLYRLVSPNHFYLAFATDIDDPFRVTEGESYYVTFDDYSDTVYQVTARAPIVFAIEPTGEEEETSTSGQGVVNILEFYTDIGSFSGIRTVNATISKAAQGLKLDKELITIENGIPYVYIKNGDALMRVEVNVLSEDEKYCVIRESGGASILNQGQKVIKP